jgi:hypothetical protein
VGLKAFGWIALSVVVAFGAGWLVGTSGRATVALELGRAQERASFLEARALVFEGRVDLLLLNYGDAGRRFGEARVIVQEIQTRLRESGQAERAGQLEIALSQLTEAEQTAVAGDSGARSAAEAALQTLQFVGAPDSSEAPSPST